LLRKCIRAYRNSEFSNRQAQGISLEGIAQGGAFLYILTWKHRPCAEIVFAAYGTTARIVKNAINSLAKEGIKAGLIRPITLWPYPYKAIEEAAEKASVKAFMSVEMSMGQMVEDVKLGVNGKKPVFFYGKTGFLRLYTVMYLKPASLAMANASFKPLPTSSAMCASEPIVNISPPVSR
jgi:hypothetical protein